MKVKKENMDKLTFCLPVRIDSDDRLNNLITVLDFYSQYTTARFIVLEADTEPLLSSLSSRKNVEYIYVKDDNPVFHRTKYINQMLSLAQTPYAAIWDVDAIAPVTQLLEAYQLLQKEPLVMAYPFDGKFWMVNEYFSQLFRKTKDIHVLQSPDMPKRPMNGFNSVGGGFLVNIEKYWACGAENEYFTGWGPEDAERYRRLEILGYPPGRIEGSMCHLNHKRGINSWYANDEVAYLTKKEFCRICGMQRYELEEYIRSWEWLK